MTGMSTVPINEFFYYVCSMSAPETVNVINREMAEYFGCEPEALAGCDVRDIFDGAEADQWINTTRDVFDKKKTVRYEQYLCNKDGQRRFLHVVKAPRFGDNGEVVGVVCACEDMTEKKKVQDLQKIQRDIAFRILTDDLEGTLETGIKAILDSTGLDFGAAAYTLDDEDIWAVPCGMGVSPEYTEALKSWLVQAKPFDGLMKASPIYNQFGELPIQKGSLLDADGIKAFAMVPIIESGKAIGVVNVGSTSSEVIPRKSRDVIEALAGEIGKGISKLRIAEAMKESEEMYRALVETSPDPILVLDMNRRIVKASRRAIGLLEMEAGDVLGKDALDFIAPEYLDAVGSDISSLLEKGILTDREYEIMKKDGNRFLFNTSFSVIHGGEGNAKYIIITGTDVTEKRKAEKKLKRINAELQSYAHTVSHDLKGPVSNIMLAGELVLQMLNKFPAGGDRDEIEEMIETIVTHSKRAHDLIQNVLVLAEVGQEPYKLEYVDLYEKVKRIVREHSAGIKENGIVMIIDSNLGTVKANRTQIYQIFSNLIINAMKHGVSDEPVIEIKRLPPERKGESRFLVRDNGPGVPQEIIDRLFTEAPETVGLKQGIGLSIVEKIIKSYSGEIKVYNDNGACFEFSLLEYSTE